VEKNRQRSRGGHPTVQFNINHVPLRIFLTKLSWILRDERFTSDPLPSFKTPDHRINWFDQVLQEQPLLYAIFIYGPFPQTIHLQYLYSSEVEWNDTGKQVRELINYRVPRILDLIFRGMFNMPQANNQFQFFTEKGRKWVGWILS